MAHQGWDSLTIDLQHGVVDYQAMVPMLQAISTTPTVPVVRVPWLEPGILMKIARRRRLRRHLPDDQHAPRMRRSWWPAPHYAPRGTRSFGPVRALLYGGADYPQHANDTIVTFAMIETAQALDNLDDILSVEGLDAIYIGPSDLSLALGCTPTFDDVDPKAAEAIDHILERAKAHGLVAGIHNGNARGRAQAHRQGFPVRHRQLRCAADRRRCAAGASRRCAPRRPKPRPARTDRGFPTSPTKGLDMKIGFIGLGIMGAPMACNLAKAGHQLFVHTRSTVRRRGRSQPARPSAPAPGSRASAPRSSS